MCHRFSRTLGEACLLMVVSQRPDKEAGKFGDMCSPRPSTPSASPALLPDPSALAIDCIAAQGTLIVFRVRTRAQTAACPECGQRAHRIHSRYRRTLSDLPWQGIPVRFQLTARKFFCDNATCPRRIFAERVPSVADRYARKTLRLSESLCEKSSRSSFCTLEA